MHTEKFCPSLGALDRVKAIRAIHEALIQLNAARSGRTETLDHGPAIESLTDCLRDSGHIGFTNDAGLI